jgi:hypothetical protein
MGVPGGGVFYLVVAVRNAFMLGFIIALLFYYWLALPRRQVKGEGA